MKINLKPAGANRLRWLISGGTALLLALLAAALLLGCTRITDRSDQQAAQRWAADDAAFAQISLFLPQGSALSPQELLRIRAQTDSRLTQASLEPANENARLWLDAASTELTGTASTDRGSASVTITAVDGDFFHFHPQQLKSGSTFSGADERRDTILLDELAAWQRFGSPDVTGRPVTLNGRLYYVCGVTAVADDSAAVLTYGERPRVWVFYESLANAETLALTCYEAVLPNPYTNFALQLAEEIFGTESRDCVLLENSVRYRASGLWSTLKGIPRASMRTSAAIFPWWENAARYQQTRAALLFGAALVCLVWPVLFAAAVLILLWKRRRWRLRDVRGLLERAIDRRRTAAWNASHPAAVSSGSAAENAEAPGYTADTSDGYNDITAPAAVPEETTEEAAP